MSSELQHYGVPGMKWGVRKKKRSTTPSKGTKAERKEQNRKKTRNAKLIVAGGAAAAAGGVYLGNRLSGGKLRGMVNDKVLLRGKVAAAQTMKNTAHWKWNAGVGPGAMAFTVGREFINNYRSVRIR